MRNKYYVMDGLTKRLLEIHIHMYSWVILFGFFGPFGSERTAVSMVVIVNLMDSAIILSDKCWSCRTVRTLPRLVTSSPARWPIIMEPSVTFLLRLFCRRSRPRQKWAISSWPSYHPWILSVWLLHVDVECESCVCDGAEVFVRKRALCAVRCLFVKWTDAGGSSV